MLSTFFSYLWKQWRYGVISLLVVLSLILATPQPAQSFSFLDLLFQGVQVFQLSNLSDSEEVQLGKQINEQLVNGQVRLSQNQQLNRYVDRIGQRIVPQTDRPNLPYTFQVVEDDSINAFATMGGFVYIHTGLMAAAENEAELASVVAHEIGHITARHAVQQMRQRAIAQGLLSATGLDESNAVQIGVELAVSRPNSREDEFEADQKGLDSLTKSGYAPIGMISFMEKLQQQGGSPPTFLSTHPAVSDRIEALKAQATNPTQGDGLNPQLYQQRTQSLK
ncbi:M48 family metallopeptidase [Dactylococcopsis salina]|uniref:Peptidase family M48 n=1 Tax=Dactylococcopsis salina (strain PCC 8305) TaxID=13035 RepID=K9YZ45_DACS8|nr:M48 family metallopeptidase [Dactylococcopsis salina]AFZ51757.1 Peptidase family M48 [Dactylococcopsis salina PCC 8305]